MSLVAVATYRDPVQAHLARALLESAGIDARIADANMIEANWLSSQLLGGAKVLVPASDAEQARALLETPVPPEPADAAPGADALRCPHCGGAGERLSGVDRRVRAFGMIVPLPLTIGRYRVRCGECHRTWRDAPPHRGLRFVVGDLLALGVIATGTLLSLPFRFLRSVWRML